MHRYSERPPDAMAGGAACTCVLFPRPTEQMQGWFYSPGQEQVRREQKLRLEERHKERERIAWELRDTLFQGFLGASQLLHTAMEQMPADSPSKASLSRALQLIYRVIDEGRAALKGLRSPTAAWPNLEQALSEFGTELTPGDTRFRIFVIGQPKPLKPTIQEQVCLIVREALVNALRHSGATRIEAKVQYSAHKLRVVVPDNGSGIDTRVLRSGQDSHWGLLGMRERARAIGAQLRIWSRRGAGTEVEISVAGDIGLDVCAYLSILRDFQDTAVA
jgi:signal transduction histidine kinase